MTSNYFLFCLNLYLGTFYLYGGESHVNRIPYSGHSIACHDTFPLVPGTVSEGLNGWSEALAAGLAVWTAKTSVTGSNLET